MSFRSDALQIKNETVEEANTASRVGGLFEKISQVVDTVDTIADLRSYDTTQLTEGDVVRVKAHNTNGLSQGYGEGVFEWITTPIFETVDSSIGYRGSTEVTALTRGLTGDGRAGATDEYYGDNLVLENGAEVTVTSVQAGNEDSTIRSYGVGETDVRLALESGSFSSGLNAYMADDDGVYIRPTYSGFDGQGYWKRQLGPEQKVTIDMYGAIGYHTFRNVTAPVNSYSAIQKAFDSLFHVVIPARSYYTDQKIVVRRPKFYSSVGHSFHLLNSTQRQGRFFKIIEGPNVGKIYTDQNIDVLEVTSSCVLNVCINCELVTNHTGAGIRLNCNDRIRGKIEASITGNPDALGPDLTTGTEAIVVDQTDPESSRDHFSSTGAVAGIQIYLQAASCYTGYHLTPRDSGVDTYVNGIRVYWSMDNVKRPIWTESGSDLSIYSGVYQSRDNLLSATEQDNIPIVDIQGLSGGYVEIFGWDMVGTGRHNQLLRIGNGSMNEAGPMLLQSNMWKQGNYVDADTKETFNLRSTISGAQEATFDRLRYIPKVVKRTVTAAELADLHNNSVEFLASSPNIDAVQIIAAHAQVVSGSTEFSGDIQLKANTGGVSYVASTLEISDLSSGAQWPHDLGVGTRQGHLTNSNSNGSCILLDAPQALTGSGDTDIEIVVLYRTVPFDQA